MQAYVPTQMTYDVVVWFKPLALFSHDSQPFPLPTGMLPFRFTAVFADDDLSPPPLGTWGAGQRMEEWVCWPAGFETAEPTMFVRPAVFPHTAKTVTVASAPLALFMSTRQDLLFKGNVELMLTAVFTELERPPPPRILYVPGQGMTKEVW